MATAGTRPKKKTSQAEAFGQIDVETPSSADCRIRIAYAQQAEGRWYASPEIVWRKGTPLKGLQTNLTPGRAKLFDSQAHAVLHGCQLAQNYLERLLLANPGEGLAERIDMALEGIGVLMARVRIEERGLSQDNAAKGKPRPTQIDAPFLDPDRQDSSGFDYTCYDESLLSRGPDRRRIPWPVDKLNVHPLNRNADPEQIGRVAELLEREGQRDAIECRVPERGWHTRTDQFCVPEGHVQILRGAHRWHAAQQLGWDHVDVVILADVSDAEALRHLARSDDQRAWTQLEKGRLAAAMRADGQTLDQIAGEFQVSDKSVVAHWVKLAALPECWRKLIDPGLPASGFDGGLIRVQPSWLRCLEKYSDAPELLDAAYAALVEQARDKRNRWQLEEALRRLQRWEQYVERLIADTYRPMEGKPYSTWRSSSARMVKHGPLFKLDEAAERELDVRVVPIAGKPTRIALAVDEFDRRQAPLVKQLQDGEIDAAGRPIKAKKSTKSTGKASGTREETAAELRARMKAEAAEARERRREQDAWLKERLSQWRLRLLRQQMARDLRVGDYQVELMLPFLLTKQQDSQHWVDKVISYVAAGKQEQLDSREFWAALTRTVLPEDPARGVADFHLQVCRLLLWPVDPDCKQVTYGVIYTEPPALSAPVPNYADKVIEQIASLAEVDVDLAWRRAAEHGSAEQTLLRQALDAHTTDQLIDVGGNLVHHANRSQKIAGKLSIQLKKRDRVAGLLKLHATSGLKRPSWLGAVK